MPKWHESVLSDIFCVGMDEPAEPRNAVDIRSLRYFVTVAQFGSITRAAAYLHVAQPALSRQVRKLERDLDVELLQRSARGILLTRAGERLVERATVILRQVDKTRAEAKSWEEDPAGPVSVAMIPAVGSIIAPRLVQEVRDRYPNIRLALGEGLSAVISQNLLDDEIELGIYHADRSDTAFHVTSLLTEPMLLIGPGNAAGVTKNAAKGPVTLAKLASYPLLLPSRPNALRLAIDRIASAKRVTLDIRENVDSSTMIKRLVQAGLGYTIQCISFVHDEVARGDLTVSPLAIPQLARDWCLVRPRDRAPAAATLAVSAIIEEIVADLVKDPGWQNPQAAGRSSKPA